MTTGLNQPVRDPDEALERITSWAAGPSEKAECYAAREDTERNPESRTVPLDSFRNRFPEQDPDEPLEDRA
ncbi:MAG TPA: hypothetical protein VFG87_28735 [Amycolatopsis sp.]|jgi:hypothetical protein|nr:hypothetical protein [Amycolatopsis sp.]